MCVFKWTQYTHTYIYAYTTVIFWHPQRVDSGIFLLSKPRSIDAQVSGGSHTTVDGPTLIAN